KYKQCTGPQRYERAHGNLMMMAAGNTPGRGEFAQQWIQVQFNRMTNRTANEDSVMKPIR
ncbi:MAG TPA: hypothetical protein PKD58_12270, partial [Candidatus Sumerlaeota bacterium]|nr:hypothetical protein [Candidatus Sumerlaeota bacterium]